MAKGTLSKAGTSGCMKLFGEQESCTVNQWRAWACLSHRFRARPLQEQSERRVHTASLGDRHIDAVLWECLGAMTCQPFRLLSFWYKRLFLPTIAVLETDDIVFSKIFS